MFITKGPCCTTGSPMGRPCSSSSSARSAPFSSAASTSGRNSMAWPTGTRWSCTCRSAPRKKYSIAVDCRELRVATPIVRLARAQSSRLRRQTPADWPTSRAAARGGLRSPRRPAMMRTCALRPASSRATWVADCVTPEHREVRLHQLVLPRQVQPDLEQLERIGRRRVEQRKHLGVHDSLARREPLHVTRRRTRRGAERIGVIDEATRTTVTVSKPRCG